MPVFWSLMVTFLIVGVVSFGGGYAMLPIIDHMVVGTEHWFDERQFVDMIALASMAPGPIAVNAAVMVGYQLIGFWGALVAATAVSLPSFLLILLFARTFFKYRTHPNFVQAFYGLRPVIVGMIFYAATSFALRNELIGFKIDWTALSLLVVSFLMFWRTRLHPALILLMFAFIGVMVRYIM
ncbi:MAG: chromate transporter [Candidatus Carbobacillus altaicus]|uniref:Chromate transport protein n=1 Tax=Candidatus Carbonibacillus altaicus TaxID=2163959 RepID=A0A2R6Y496_9BACL|nr:chromate transporter [Candidatus Carbobacillus altaicus]PTQ57494.1 MAG: Chromate transport protein [Candidatus Carbobacillus altaicus]